jgi:hypothetical protein
MRKAIILAMAAALLLYGCAGTEKGIWIHDSLVVVIGDVKPEFLRDGTTETQSIKPDVKPDIDASVVPK